MNHNVSNQELYEALKSAIHLEKPFSYVRIGDGELAFLARPEHFKTKEEWYIVRSTLKSVCRRYWKDYFLKYDHDHPSNNSEFIVSFREIIRETISASDYLGLFSKDTIDNLVEIGSLKEEKREEWYNHYIPRSRIFTDAGIDLKNLKICNPLFSRYPEIGNIDNFKRLVQTRPITILTSNRRLEDNKKFHELLGKQSTVYYYGKSPKSGEKGGLRTYWQRDSIKELIPHIKDHIVLYALGGGGKDLCHILKNDYGKCVIDMGSTIDAWAGNIPRPRFKTVWKHCLTVPVSEAIIKSDR